MTDNAIEHFTNLNEKICKSCEGPREIKSAQEAGTCIDALTLPEQGSAAAGEIVHLLFEPARVFYRRLAAREQYP
ncbi:MAG: hypothetical protein GY767_11230 [Shimia sp.]|nr:hypothetical protein [Shimia sp.]MCP4826583.1 hypothetical protein [Shimia sp.]